MSDEIYKAMGVDPINLSPVERKAMLSDEMLTNAFFGSKYAGDHTIHQLDGAKAARMWYEAKITSGELMVVKTVKESSIPRYRGDQHMPCCGHMIDCVESFPPEVGQHCVCGAKIVE